MGDYKTSMLSDDVRNKPKHVVRANTLCVYSRICRLNNNINRAPPCSERNTTTLLYDSANRLAGLNLNIPVNTRDIFYVN
jgi:hypothetical protein